MRVRRGPATATGDATRESPALEPLVRRRAGRDGAAGGELPMLVDASDANFNPTVFPFVLGDVPATAVAGTPFAVT